MDQPQVSVIIPCFEQQAFLGTALDSLLGQGDVQLEAIVIDDGSANAVLLPRTDYPFPIRLIRTPNRGLSRARNLGLRLARAPFVKFLDADDELLPGSLARQVASLGTRQDAISLIGFELLNEADGCRTPIIPAFGDFAQALLVTNLGPPVMYLYPTRLVRAQRGFSASERTRGGHEDYDLTLRLAANGVDCVSVHAVGVRYLKRVDSMSSRRVTMARTRLLVWSEHLPRFLAQGSEPVCLAALAGWIQLCRETPPEVAAPLAPAATRLAHAIAALPTPCSSEWDHHRQALLDIRHPASRRLLRSLPGGENRTGSCAFLHPLEIIDRRLTQTEDVWIASFLRRIQRLLNGAGTPQFAIYGAGRLGRILLRKLADLNLRPAVLIDREAAAMGGSMEGIPLIPPEVLPSSSVRHIVIAAQHNSTEIRAKLSDLPVQLKIIAP